MSMVGCTLSLSFKATPGGDDRQVSLLDTEPISCACKELFDLDPPNSFFGILLWIWPVIGSNCERVFDRDGPKKRFDFTEASEPLVPMVDSSPFSSFKAAPAGDSRGVSLSDSETEAPPRCIDTDEICGCTVPEPSLEESPVREATPGEQTLSGRGMPVSCNRRSTMSKASPCFVCQAAISL